MKRLTALAVIGLFGATAFGRAPVSNLPVSSQATFVESYSPAEVTINATGMGGKHGFFDDMEKNALLDARKSAVNFVLTGGTDPLLNTPAAKNTFAGVAEDFFANDNVMKYISWEADNVISTIRTKLPSGDDGIKTTKLFRVNKQKLSEYLGSIGIVATREQLADAQGTPTIMVIPEVPKGQTPIQVFDSNPLAKQAAAVIESYLTARKYDVIVPRAQEQLNDMTQMQGEMKGVDADPSYELALSLGSDVYIVYSGSVTNGKASVQVKAYETTTGRLLGTETGYSATRSGAAQEALVEEAINGAIDNVLARLTAYWTDDLKQGIQYKLIFKVTGTFSDIETVQDKLSDAISEGFAKSKENIVTDKTMDYQVWAKKDEFKQANNVYRFLKDKMKGTAKLTKVSINRKLIIATLGNE